MSDQCDFQKKSQMKTFLAISNGITINCKSTNFDNFFEALPSPPKSNASHGTEFKILARKL